MAMNFEVARHNMVEQQVRTWEVLEPRVLDVLGTVPREDFVNPRYRKMAYADTALPLEHGEMMMKPVVEGRLMQALNPQDGETLLEIGTGSGYLTACLAQLAGKVISIDCNEGFVQTARRRLQDLGDDLRNDPGNDPGHDLENGLRHIDVTIAHADAFNPQAMADLLDGQIFDAIAVTGSAEQIPEAFLQWLKPGGRLFMVKGFEPAMEACLMNRLEDSGYAEESLFETDLGRLRGAEDRAKFVL